MGDLENFMKNNQPDGRVSKLEPFEQEIMILKKNGYTEKSILKFLAEAKNVVVSQPSLNKFIRKCSLNVSTAIASKPLVKLTTEPIKEVSDNDNPSAEIKPSGSFDWQSPVDPNQYL